MILAFMISFVIPVKRVRPIRGSALVHIITTAGVKCLCGDCKRSPYASSLCMAILGIMDCILFTFENRVPLKRLGASVVWHLLLPLMNSFTKTEATVVPCMLCFVGDFPFLS